MLGAVVGSGLFLASDVNYHHHAGPRPFTGHGWIRPVYFFILITHVVLAGVIVPLALGYSFWGGWLFWVVLLLFLGLGHPSTVDAGTPLSGGRRLSAWLTIALSILTFSPVPISLAPGGQPPAPQEKVYSVTMHRAPAHGAALHRLPIEI